MAHTDFFLQNSILNAAFVGWFVAQTLKVIFSSYKGKKIDFSRFTGAGGMPSSHTSTVIALTTACFVLCGYYSVEFAVSLILSVVVMYDATGVRRAAGEQAKILNSMMSHINETTPETFKKELKELLGHTPLEVVAGAVLGIIIGAIVVQF